MISVQCEYVSYKNTKPYEKPNEDLVIYNELAKVGVLLDGVSRDKENGHYPIPSPAVFASELFSKTVLSTYSQSERKGLSILKRSIELANTALRKYNDKLKHRFPAGTVGICFSIDKNLFNYAYIGDCYAAIARNGIARNFTECQTLMVAKHKKEFTSDQIRFQICNNIAHPCGYGVWDGNPDAMDFTKYGQIRVFPGDVILIYSDGMEQEVQERDLKSLISNSLHDLFDANMNLNLDDRSFLRIKFE